MRRTLAVDEAKAALKRLGDRERLLVLAWLCVYFDDDGALKSPQIQRKRRRIALDGIAYWLVRIPVNLVRKRA